MGLNAGDLRRRVRIERRGTGTDAIGQPLDTWEEVATVWADIRGFTGIGTISRLQEGIPGSVERYSIRIRYREDVVAGMRVVHGGQVFDVRHVRMDYAGREYTDLVCELVTHAG